MNLSTYFKTTLLLHTLIFTFSLGWSQRTIKGVVVSEDSSILYGASILTKGMNVGVFTDDEGKFEYNLPDQDKIGLRNIRLSLSGQNLLTFGDGAILQNQQEWIQFSDPLQYVMPQLKSILLGLKMDIL